MLDLFLAPGCLRLGRVGKLSSPANHEWISELRPSLSPFPFGKKRADSNIIFPFFSWLILGDANQTLSSKLINYSRSKLSLKGNLDGKGLRFSDSPNFF